MTPRSGNIGARNMYPPPARDRDREAPSVLDERARRVGIAPASEMGAMATIPMDRSTRATGLALWLRFK